MYKKLSHCGNFSKFLMVGGIMQVGKGLHFQGQDSFSYMLYMCFNVDIKWLKKKEQKRCHHGILITP